MRSANEERPPVRSTRAVRAHTASTTSTVAADVVAACNMSPGIAEKRVRSHRSQAQRSVRNSGIQKLGIEHNRLHPTTAKLAEADKRLREAAAAAGGIGF